MLYTAFVSIYFEGRLAFFSAFTVNIAALTASRLGVFGDRFDFT